MPLTYIDTGYDLTPIESIYTSTIYLPMGGTTLDLRDYMTFTDSDGNVTSAKSLTYTVTTAGYSSYFSIEDGKITSKTGITASSGVFEIEVVATSYGDDSEKSVTLKVYLTDLAILDSDAENEIDEINIVEGESTTVYVQKFGSAGSLSLVEKVEEGDGIDATISNTSTTVNSLSVYPLTIQGTNEGTVILTVLEERGKATKELIVNVYNVDSSVASASLTAEESSSSETEIEFTALDETETVTISVGDNFDIDEDGSYVNWSSSNTSVATVQGDGLTSSITSVGFGTAVIYCEIVVNNNTLTTYEISVTVTGVSIDDLTMNVGDEKTITYTVDSNISSSSISGVSWTSSDGTIVSVDTSDETYYGILTANKTGTAKLTITVTLNNGTKYTDTCTITVND